jgi:hypothetical protein
MKLRLKGDVVKRGNVGRLNGYVIVTAVFVLVWIWIWSPAILLWWANR